MYLEESKIKKKMGRYKLKLIIYMFQFLTAKKKKQLKDQYDEVFKKKTETKL